MIRIALVDDQALVRQGLRALLDMVSDMRVVFEASDGQEAIDGLEGAAVDVLILDLRMPRCPGLEVLRRLKEKDRLPPTLVLTTFDDERAMLEALSLGARGYLLKDVGFEELTSGVRELAGGGTYLQALSAARASSRTREAAPAEIEPMSPRERQVLRLMGQGLSNPEIARALGLAHGTVKNHVSVILGKLEVSDRTRAILKAMSAGLI